MIKKKNIINLIHRSARQVSQAYPLNVLSIILLLFFSEFKGIIHQKTNVTIPHCSQILSNFDIIFNYHLNLYEVIPKINNYLV